MECNPFVEARPNERDLRHFLAREREALDLLSLSQRGRVVSFDVPYSAAKRSFVDAQIIPALSRAADPLQA
jgi:hypothetical protein